MTEQQGQPPLPLVAKKAALAAIVIAALAIAIVQPAEAQSTPSSVNVPGLEGASVRRLDSGPRIFPHVINAQQFEATGTLADLIQWAYGLGRDFQVTDGPDWVGAPYFDSSGVRVWPAADVFEIHAMAQRPVNEAEMKQRIRDLLAVLFKLELHRETRPIPIYALVAGLQGPNLPPGIEPAPCPVPAGECGFPNIGGPEGGVHTITARGATMSGFASLLTNNIDRPVIDKTGLTTGYSFDLPYEHSGPGWRVGPAIFPAIQTLGLRLEPQTETMEVVVIDSVERFAGR